MKENGTISQLIYVGGCKHLSDFSHPFRDHLGQSPSAYVEALK